MSTRLAGLATFSMASAMRRMTRGAALTAAAPSAVEVARPMLSLALVRPAQHRFHCISTYVHAKSRGLCAQWCILPGLHDMFDSPK